MAIKIKDFVEVEYTGKLKEEGITFDTTNKKLAEEAGIPTKNMEFGPVIVCIGEQHLIKGLEDQLIDKDFGKKYTINLTAEQGFGKKDASLIKMIPFRLFKKQGVMPEPGMQVNVDNMIGIIKTAKGGRCLVDFNHPLSGKEIVYDVKIVRKVEDIDEKVRAYIRLNLNLSTEVSEKDGVVEVKARKEIPPQLQDSLIKHLKDLIPGISEVKLLVDKKIEKPIPDKKQD